MSYHKTIVQGTVGKVDPLKQVGESEVCNFSVAVNEKYNGTETTTWYNCAAWGKSANIASEYLSKGKPVLVEGTVSTRAYNDSNGDAKSTLQLRVFQLKFIDGVPSNASSDDNTPQDDNSGMNNIPF